MWIHSRLKFCTVRLRSRALEILIVLVRSAGELVSKEELVERICPNTFVEESNLKVHVARFAQAVLRPGTRASDEGVLTLIRPTWR